MTQTQFVYEFGITTTSIVQQQPYDKKSIQTYPIFAYNYSNQFLFNLFLYEIQTLVFNFSVHGDDYASVSLFFFPGSTFRSRSSSSFHITLKEN